MKTEDQQNGNTPLMLASVQGYTNDVKIMIEKDKSIVHQVNDQNEDALLFTVKNCDNRFTTRQMAKILLNNGSDVNLKNSEGKSAMMYAQDKGYDRVVNLLRDSGANENQ